MSFQKHFVVAFVLSVAQVLAMPSLFCLAAAGKEDAKASQLARRALKVYRQGALREAAALFLKAYELSNRPAQLRNSAKAYEESGELLEALTLWQKYRAIEGLPEEDAYEADAHIQGIKQKIQTASSSSERIDGSVRSSSTRNMEASPQEGSAKGVGVEEAGRSSEPPSHPREGSASKHSDLIVPPLTADTEPPMRTAPWIRYGLIGSGGASLLGGGLLFLLSSQQLSELDKKIAMRDTDGRIVGITPAEVESQTTSVNTKRIASGVLLGAGLLAAGVGLYLSLFEEPEHPRVASKAGGEMLPLAWHW